MKLNKNAIAGLWFGAAAVACFLVLRVAVYLMPSYPIGTNPPYTIAKGYIALALGLAVPALFIAGLVQFILAIVWRSKSPTVAGADEQRGNHAMTDSSFRIEGHAVVLGGDGDEVRCVFEHPVAEVLEFETVLVVRTTTPPSIVHNENVYGMGRDGSVLWQIGVRDYVYEYSPYVRLFKLGEHAELYNWGGISVEVDPVSGAEIAWWETK